MNTFALRSLWTLPLLLAAPSLVAAYVIVPGTSDIYLAGMPDGSTASQWVSPAPDVAPQQSPVFARAVMGGKSYLFAASGFVINYPVTPPLTVFPPDGELGQWVSHLTGSENGIATVHSMPMNALLGLFLDGNQPDTTGAPDGLDFSVIGLDFATLSPQLKQPFFIGDGLTSGGATQRFVAPAGATRLFLGTMDSYEWWNNMGEFRVSVAEVPEPAHMATMAGLAVLAWVLGRRLRIS